MHRTKAFILAAALCLCAALTALALSDGALKTVWDSGCDFLFHTDNVTVTGQATFSLDGERFKTAELNYIQDGYKSCYGLKLLTPWSDGTEHETGWTIIAAGDGTITVMEAYTPGEYKWATGEPQNTLLRRTVRLDALTELGGLLAGSVESLLPEGAVTVTEADGTKTVHIALREGQIPDTAVSALNVAAGYLSDRWFCYGYDRYIIEDEAFAFDQYVTVTEALTDGTVRWALKNVDADFVLDAQSRLAGVRGTVKVASEYWDGTVRDVEVKFDFAATDYGASAVKPFDPDDYGVKPAAARPEEAPEGEELIGEASDWEFDLFRQATGSLPAYAYPGSDPIEAAVAAYTAETLGAGFLLPEGAVSIPAPVILKTETKDDGTATVYGNFWVLNYILRRSELHCVSGGEAPGVMTLAKDGDGWKVTAFEEAGDGEDYAKDIERFCQGDKDLEKAYFDAVDVSEDPLKTVRHQFIQDYVTAGKLAVSAYQDYGWKPIALTPGSAPKTVTALALEIDPVHPASVSAYARIKDYNADENRLTVTLLMPERFPAEDVLSLIPGDAIYTEGREIPVRTVGEKYGYIVINEDENDPYAEDTLWLYEETDGTLAISTDEDRSWNALDEAAFPVKDSLLFLDGIDPATGNPLDMPTVHSAAEFLETLKAEAEAGGPGFDVNNVFVAFDGEGQLALIQRYYVPWQ